jgi:hypothetical protein
MPRARLEIVGAGWVACGARPLSPLAIIFPAKAGVRAWVLPVLP